MKLSFVRIVRLITVIQSIRGTRCQWRSQDITDARAQHGHTPFVRTSAQSAEAFGGGGSGPYSPQENY